MLHRTTKTRGLKADSFLQKGTAIMKTIAIATVLSAVFFVVTPAAAETVTFVHDGTTYTYTIETKKGVRIISGQQKGGDRFRLVVNRGRVSGEVGSRPVSFRVKDAVTEAPARPLETAAR